MGCPRWWSSGPWSAEPPPSPQQLVHVPKPPSALKACVCPSPAAVLHFFLDGRWGTSRERLAISKDQRAVRSVPGLPLLLAAERLLTGCHLSVDVVLGDVAVTQGRSYWACAVDPASYLVKVGVGLESKLQESFQGAPDVVSPRSGLSGRDGVWGPWVGELGPGRGGSGRSGAGTRGRARRGLRPRGSEACFSEERVAWKGMWGEGPSACFHLSLRPPRPPVRPLHLPTPFPTCCLHQTHSSQDLLHCVCFQHPKILPLTLQSPPRLLPAPCLTSPTRVPPRTLSPRTVPKHPFSLKCTPI